MIVGDRQQPGARSLLFRLRRKRIDRDQKDLVGCVGGVLRTLQEYATSPKHGGKVRLIEAGQPPLLLGGHGLSMQGSQVIHFSLH